MIATNFRAWHAVALVLLVGLATAGCDHVTDPDGPNLTDRFSDFAFLDALEANRAEVDFAAGESVTFAGRFNKPVNWVIEIVGQESGAVKRIEEFSAEVTADNARWSGGTTSLPFFKDEPVEARLFVPTENSDTTRTTIEVLTPREYPGNVVADFEEDDGAEVFVGDFEFEFDLQATGPSDVISPAEGDFFYLLRSKGGPTVADPFFIGLIGITPSASSDDTYFAVPTNVPEDLFFNTAIYSFGTPYTIAVIQVGTDTNGNGVYDDGVDAVTNVFDSPVDWEGWQLTSVSMADTGFTSEQLDAIITVRVLLISNDNDQPDPPLPVEFGVDYITFTAGGPLQL